MDRLDGSVQPGMGDVRRTQAHGGLLAIEVDHFDLIDRTHGAQVTDTVLRHVTSALHGVLGQRDLVSRLHGGEFTAFLPGAGVVEAKGRAEEVAAELRRVPVALAGGRQLPLTLSIGVADSPEHGVGQVALLAAARRARARVSTDTGDGVAVALPPAEEPASPPIQFRGSIGRSDQLRALVRVLEEAFSGRPALAVVHAEQGVGVSTLLRSLSLEARVRGGAAVFARAMPADVRPAYGVWRQVVEKLLVAGRVTRGDWSELPNLVPGAGSRFPMDPVGGRGSGSQYRLLEELTECIGAVADGRPLVISLEGMQWADPASWDALEHVLGQLRDKPVLLVVSVADDRLAADVRERRVALAERSRVVEVAVPRLTRDEVKRWLEHAFNGQDVGRELLSFVYGHTRGNALFIHQLLRAMVEEGAVWHTGERWEWRPASELRFPAGLEALLVRRLERLPGRDQLALATASVIGRSFDASLLAAIMGGGEQVTRQVIADALQAGVLEPEEPGSHRLRFVHQLVADVLRSHLPPKRRQRIHRDIAAALSAFGTGDDGEIAAHFERAGVQREAYARAMAAADRAERLYAFASASECLQLAARNASGPQELAEARARMANLAERLGRFDEAEELCDLAIEWFAGQEEHEETVSLRLLRERARDQLGQPARRTLEALAQLDREAAALKLRGERVSILIALSLAWGRLGDPAAAERIAGEAVQMATQLGDARLLATALNRHAAALEPGREEEARALLRRAIALFQQVGDSRGQARGYNNLGVMYQREGDLTGAAEALQMAVAVARTAKMPDIWGTAALNLGVFRLKDGVYDEARAFFEQALSLFTAVKTAELQLYALYNLAHVERAEGRQREAAEMYEMAASLAQRIGVADVELGATAGAGLALLGEGRLEGAVEALKRVAARVVSRSDWFQGRELVEALAVTVAIERGDTAEGVGQFVRALALASGNDPYGGAWLTAACAEALLPHAPEEVEKAIATYGPRVATLGFAELTARFRELTGGSVGHPAPERRGN
jgi:diguanylate cyclase (GGDEF)-like protein